MTPDCSCYITTAKVLATKRKAAVAFLAAEMKGLSYALGHEAETNALSNKLAGIKADDPNAKLIFDEAKNDKLVDPTVGIDPKKLVYLRELLSDGGLIPKTFDPVPLVDSSVRAEALQAVQAK